MVEKDQLRGSAEDDVILSATCKRNTVWLWLGLITTTIAGIQTVVLWSQGNPFASIPFGLGFVYLLVQTFDLLFLRRITFYRDRLVKDRSLLGRKTIFYHQAQVDGPSGGGRWLYKSYVITTLKEDGRPFFIQLPICMYANQFSAETMANIDAVMAYLKECTQQGSGAAEGCTLTRDVLYRDKVQA